MAKDAVFIRDLLLNAARTGTHHGPFWRCPSALQQNPKGSLTLSLRESHMPRNRLSHPQNASYPGGPPLSEEHFSFLNRTDLLTINQVLRRIPTVGLAYTGFCEPYQLRGIRTLGACRTPDMGPPVFQKGFKGEYVPPCWASCGRGDCPNCNLKRNATWIANRRAETLPIPYWHVIFKVPRDFKDFISGELSRNLRTFIKSYMSSCMASLLAVPKGDIGAGVGVEGCYATAAGNLFWDHHVHCLVTSGGLDKHRGWLSYPEGEFASPEALGALLRAFLLESLIKECRSKRRGASGLWYAGRRATPDEIRELFASIPDEAWTAKIVPANDGPEPLLRYLVKNWSPFQPDLSYAFEPDGKVLFFARDGASGRMKPTRLEPKEFQRRAALSILPPGVHRRRSAGFLAAAGRKKRLAAARRRITALQARAARKPRPSRPLPHPLMGPFVAEKGRQAPQEVPCRRMGGCLAVGHGSQRATFVGDERRQSDSWRRTRGPPGTGARATRPSRVSTKESVGDVSHDPSYTWSYRCPAVFQRATVSVNVRKGSPGPMGSHFLTI